MSLEYIKRLPTPDEIKEEFPLSDELTAIKTRRDAEIADVFTGNSDKFLVIVGPCSADNEDSVCEYVSRSRISLFLSREYIPTSQELLVKAIKVLPPNLILRAKLISMPVL